MNGRKDSNALVAKKVEQVNELDLAPDVEILCGFVEKKQLGLLGEAECDFYALTLATAQLVEDAILKSRDIREIEGTIYGHAVLEVISVPRTRLQKIDLDAEQT